MSENNIEQSASGSSLREMLAETRRVVEGADDTAEDYAARRQADDRSKIANVIIYLFAALICAFFVFVIVQSYFPTDPSDGAKLMLDALKTLVLPILTLVLGYYFGSSKQ